jgi:DNA-directed RNA polymerase specialized sigma24 family protein
MTKAVKHTETTQYLHDSKTWLYRFMYAMFYDYINKANYTYDAARQSLARAFGNVNYDYFSNMNYLNNISISPAGARFYRVPSE